MNDPAPASLISISELAERLHLPRATVRDRLKRLQETKGDGWTIRAGRKILINLRALEKVAPAFFDPRTTDDRLDDLEAKSSDFDERLTALETAFVRQSA